MGVNTFNKNYTCDWCDGLIVSGTGYIDETDGFAVHYSCWFDAIKDKVKRAVYEAKVTKSAKELLGSNGSSLPTSVSVEPMWKTKDGKVMLISEMTDSHLLAATNKLKTSAVNAIMFKGLNTTVIRYLQHTKYSKLLEEIKKRGLSYEENSK